MEHEQGLLHGRAAYIFIVFLAMMAQVCG